MLGAFEIVEQPELTKLPQKAASALSALEDLIGANYKVTNFVGTQVVKGINYAFIVEQTTVTMSPERHLCLVIINEFDGKYNDVRISRII